MSTIKTIQKNQIISTKEILTFDNKEYQNSTRAEKSFGMEIIMFIYLIFRIFRKFKINFDINLNISGKSKKP
jgi:hypothetical protein